MKIKTEFGMLHQNYWDETDRLCKEALRTGTIESDKECGNARILIVQLQDKRVIIVRELGVHTKYEVLNELS